MSAFITLACVLAIAPASAVAVGSGPLWVDPAACPAPGVFCSIDAAVGSAVSGDTILVRPGTYASFSFQSKAVVVRSDEDGDADTIDPNPVLTIIQGGGSAPVVLFPAGSGNAVLEGFTLTGGVAMGDGGGIHCNFSSPTIRDNVITGCTAAGKGGGILLANSTGLIEGNRIEHCEAERGGAIYVEGGAAVVIRDNTIDSNRATDEGGGLFLAGNIAAVTRNRITRNSATDGGGGMRLEGIQASAVVEGNLIAGNTETKYGGAGLFVNGGAHPDVVNNLFLFNSTSGDLAYGGASLVNGSGSTPVVFRNNTFVGNSAKQGGALFATGDSHIEVRNGILWHNSANLGTAGFVQGAGSSLTVSHSDVEGGVGALAKDNALGMLIYDAISNSSVDPLFASPNGFDGLPSTWVDNDYHLTWDSECLDTGGSAWQPMSDFEGDPRPIDGDSDGIAQVDRGADEAFPHLYHLGIAKPGETITLGVTGPPGSLAFVYLSFAKLRTPIFLPAWGTFYLDFPIIDIWPVGALPPPGVATISAQIPVSAPVGVSLYLQAAIGHQLSNLDVIVIE